MRAGGALYLLALNVLQCTCTCFTVTLWRTLACAS